MPQLTTITTNATQGQVVREGRGFGAWPLCQSTDATRWNPTHLETVR